MPSTYPQRRVSNDARTRQELWETRIDISVVTPGNITNGRIGRSTRREHIAELRGWMRQPPSRAGDL